jgi:hypothetical protein
MCHTSHHCLLMFMQLDMDVEVDAVLDHLGVRHHLKPDAGAVTAGIDVLPALKGLCGRRPPIRYID